MKDNSARFTKRNLTPAEAAEFLCCSVKTVYKLIAEGAFLAFPLRGNVRGALRIAREDLEAYERRQIEKYAERNGFSLRIAHD